jgi:hypothetical protein
MIDTPLVATASALLKISARMAQKILLFLGDRTTPAAPQDSNQAKICWLLDTPPRLQTPRRSHHRQS